MQQVMVQHLLILSLIIFLLAFVSLAFNRKNIISILFALELMLLAANLNFVVGSVIFNDVTGQIFVLFALAVACAELAIGLALAVCLYKKTKSISLDLLGRD